MALAWRLRERGHTVSFAVERNFLSTVVALGFAVAPLTGDSAQALRPYQRHIFADANALTSLSLLLDHYVAPTLPAKIRELRAACEGANLLVAAASQLVASIVADLSGIRWASVMITPARLPSACIAPQPPLAVLAASPAFLAPPPDWPPQLRMTGFCFWDADPAWEPPPDLAAYLAATQASGQPLVAVTSGSVAPDIADAFLPFYAASLAPVAAIRVSDCCRCGQRIRGLSGLSQPSSPSRLAPSSCVARISPRR
ncbi:MAG: hypothetical protein ABI068_09955 [Ktedonobacterales bacterium]